METGNWNNFPASFMGTSSPSDDSSSAVCTARLLNASARKIFAAFENAERLAKWWGPAGFTNTFSTFEFQEGGNWIFAMHAPNGSDFPNESIFREIEPDRRIVVEHVVKPWYRLTVTLTPEDGKTRLDWHQEFESPEFAAKMRLLSTTANEQVLDRLEAVLAG